MDERIAPDARARSAANAIKQEEGRPFGRPSYIQMLGTALRSATSGLRGAGPQDVSRELAVVVELGGDVGLDLAADAFGAEDADLLALVGEFFVDTQREIGYRAGAVGDFRNGGDGFEAGTGFLQFHRGDDRRGDRLGQVGVDVKGGGATRGAAVEDDQRTLGRDRGLFRELDRDGGRAFADDRGLAVGFGGLGVGRLQLAAGAGRVALDVDGRVFRVERGF